MISIFLKYPFVSDYLILSERMSLDCFGFLVMTRYGIPLLSKSMVTNKLFLKAVNFVITVAWFSVSHSINPKSIKYDYNVE